MANPAEQKYLEAQGGTAPEAPVPLTPPVCPQDELPVTPNNKRGILEAYILGVSLGWLGAHHFYLRRPSWGVLYLFTFGLLGVGYIVDWFRMPFLVKRANQKLQNGPSCEKHLDSAYVLWFPLGLFGYHHFYLRQWGWGVVYHLTFGLLGLGWLMDAFCIPAMVRDHNVRVRASARASQEVDPPNAAGTPTPKSTQPDVPHKTLTTAYRLCLFPVTGLLGGHHYYMGRIAFGLFCTFTLGGLGLSWLADWFRLPVLVKDANKRIQEGKGFRERRLDDCYLVAFPAGLFGAHHFYLRRVGWGFLYFFTFGCLGIGWIVDLIRMYKLVRSHQEEMEAQRRQIQSGNVTGHVNAAAVVGTQPPLGPDGNPQYITVMPPGTNIPQHVHTLAPGTYAITPAPPYTPLPGPAVLPQIPPGYSQLPGPTAPDCPQIPPNYGAINGYSSWSTIDSSDVDQPPSYDESLDGPHNKQIS